MRDYATLFETIAKTMNHDYAGFEISPAHDRAAVYAGQLVRIFRLGRLDDTAFVAIVNEYLSEYRDRNVRLLVRDADGYRKTACGFRVRRYEDGLRVTETREEKRLRPGDVITRISRMPVDRLAASGSPVFYGTVPERELWDAPLDGAWSYTLADGTELKAVKYPCARPDGGLLLEMRGDTAVVTLSGPVTAGHTTRFFAEHEATLRGAARLILDMRRAEGEDLDAFFPLAPYITDGRQMLSALFDTGGAFVNYSGGNCRAWRRRYESFAEEYGEAGKTLLLQMLAELDEKKDSGFVFEPDEPLGDLDRAVEPAGPPGNTIILTDMFCGGEAERFVYLAGKSPRVTIVGRQTEGALAFCRPVSIPLDDGMALTYPTAKAAFSNEKHFTGSVTPDSVIPWTPEEIFRDAVLEKALDS